MPRQDPPSFRTLARLGLRAAGIAHDIGQPLTVALLAVRQVEGKGARRLRQALHRMEDLLARIRSELRPAPARRAARVDLAAVHRHLLAGLGPAERRRTRIRLAGTTDVDALVLQRILGNLILNALRHGSGPVLVQGSARGVRLAITVKAGAGKRPGKPGWGIGLASCQDLAARHDLSLAVDISPAGSKATLARRR